MKMYSVHSHTLDEDLSQQQSFYWTILTIDVSNQRYRSFKKCSVKIGSLARSRCISACFRVQICIVHSLFFSNNLKEYLLYYLSIVINICKVQLKAISDTFLRNTVSLYEICHVQESLFTQTQISGMSWFSHQGNPYQ